MFDILFTLKDVSEEEVNYAIIHNFEGSHE